jgi:hypothetical protein
MQGKEQKDGAFSVCLHSVTDHKPFAPASDSATQYQNDLLWLYNLLFPLVTTIILCEKKNSACTAGAIFNLSPLLSKQENTPMRVDIAVERGIYLTNQLIVQSESVLDMGEWDVKYLLYDH